MFQPLCWNGKCEVANDTNYHKNVIVIDLHKCINFMVTSNKVMQCREREKCVRECLIINWSQRMILHVYAHIFWMFFVPHKMINYLLLEHIFCVRERGANDTSIITVPVFDSISHYMAHIYVWQKYNFVRQKKTNWEIPIKFNILQQANTDRVLFHICTIFFVVEKFAHFW